MKMENLTDIDFVYGDPTVKKDLEMMPLEQYDGQCVCGVCTHRETAYTRTTTSSTRVRHRVSQTMRDSQ